MSAQNNELQANKECPYCNARIIGSAVIHEPDCPTWDMYCEESYREID